MDYKMPSLAADIGKKEKFNYFYQYGNHCIVSCSSCSSYTGITRSFRINSVDGHIDMKIVTDHRPTGLLPRKVSIEEIIRAHYASTRNQVRFNWGGNASTSRQNQDEEDSISENESKTAQSAWGDKILEVLSGLIPCK